MIRAGFVYPAQAGGWLGGVNYLRNLFLALTATADCGVAPVLLAGRRARVVDGFPVVEVVRTALADARTPGGIARLALRKISGSDVLLDRALRSHRIDVLSHSGCIGPGARTRAIAWIPDFQHRHLPAFFSPQQRAQRDTLFEATCRHASRVLVSSEAALRDVERFLPAWASKTRVLRFVDCSATAETAISPAELEKRHGYSGPFLLLPNQFWAHKNHRLVLEALALLKKQGRVVQVLVTGSARDDRNPGFFDELMRQRAVLGVEESFRVLGMVPFADLAALMRHAVAIVNPSLFEGWSTTVEEAKSLGKRVLLSDIAVHREQAPDRGTFFDPASPAQLAEALWDAWAKQDAGAEAAAAARAAAALPSRRRAFAEAYAAVVREVLADPEPS